jgi:hypothetical protein
MTGTLSAQRNGGGARCGSAARDAGGSPAGVFAQAVIFNADREVVFPPDGSAGVSRGNWKVAPKVVFCGKKEADALSGIRGPRGTTP